MQELFYGPYFCAEQQDQVVRPDRERIPDGPTTKLMWELAKKHKMVLVVPMYEEEMTGVYYNTAAVIDSLVAPSGSSSGCHQCCGALRPRKSGRTPVRRAGRHRVRGPPTWGRRGFARYLATDVNRTVFRVRAHPSVHARSYP